MHTAIPLLSATSIAEIRDHTFEVCFQARTERLVVVGQPEFDVSVLNSNARRGAAADASACGIEARPVILPSAEACFIVERQEGNDAASGATPWFMLLDVLQSGSHAYGLRALRLIVPIPRSSRVAAVARAAIRDDDLAVDRLGVHKRDSVMSIDWTITNRSTETRVICSSVEEGFRAEWTQPDGRRSTTLPPRAPVRTADCDCHTGAIRSLRPGEAAEWRMDVCAPESNDPEGSAVRVTIAIAMSNADRRRCVAISRTIRGVVSSATQESNVR